MSVIEQCLAAFREKKYRILTDAVVGRGATGVVYQFCTDTDCNQYVAKVILFNKGGRWNVTADQFEKESQMSKLMGERKVSPAFLDSLLCRELNLGIIVVARMQVTLHKWLREAPSRYTDELKMFLSYKVYDMAVKGFYNSDLHSENIMLNIFAGNVQDLRFIDAGYVRLIGPHENVNSLAYSMWQKLQNSITKVTLAPAVKPARQLTATQLDSSSSQSSTRKKRALPQM